MVLLLNILIKEVALATFLCILRYNRNVIKIYESEVKFKHSLLIKNKQSRLVYNLFNTKIIFVVKKELLIMYEVNVMVYGPEGEDLGYKRYCSNDELEQLLRTCDSSEIEYKELKEARYSESMETCFCPYCMRMEFMQGHKEIYTCKDCHNKYFVKL